eukprot:CAMPEP_0114492288 /NCGR_PEP_ID=MMETSP0109-20121206/3471_1 /TAXON_ID=29199 /ORGANISM="Chlorarachnion reptans, Strain CCCM449" /LENGTH=221 /DNA_ID=CAMNT_0001669113 /DNA_START=318 /DNA_END=983 /DNA_ORIENTATION=+
MRKMKEENAPESSAPLRSGLLYSRTRMFVSARKQRKASLAKGARRGEITAMAVDPKADPTFTESPQDKWAIKVDDNRERFESVKCAVVGAVSGSLLSAPIAILSPNRLTAQWEFDHDAVAVMLALAALVYRYAVRKDGNMMLKQGVVSAFVLTRTLSLLKVSTTCTSLPLNCGPPLGYLDWGMIGQGILILFESSIAFGGMAVVLEKGFEAGLLKKFPSSD